jgi:uncharacterized membrane protein (Fun14 family)
MNFDTLTPIATSIGGGFFIGIMLGYFVKKILKILMFAAGGLIGLLLYLQHQQIISVNIEKLEGSSTFMLTSITASFDKVTQIGETSSLGIPLTASMTAGFTIGLIKA